MSSSLHAMSSRLRCRKTRKQSFTTQEVDKLVLGIKQYYNVLFESDVNSSSVSRDMRQSAWLDILQSVNEVAGVEKRSLQELKLEWRKRRLQLDDEVRTQGHQICTVDDDDEYDSEDNMPLISRLSKSNDMQSSDLSSNCGDLRTNINSLRTRSGGNTQARDSQPPLETLVTSGVQQPKEEMCLRWNNHHANMQTAFPNILFKEQYVDVTLAAEGKTLKCHRLVLSSCSPYFEDILSHIEPQQHPVIFMRDIPFWVVRSLCDFMYVGQVNIYQDHLEEFLAAAESLKIKGLAGRTQNVNFRKNVHENSRQSSNEQSSLPPGPHLSAGQPTKRSTKTKVSKEESSMCNNISSHDAEFERTKSIGSYCKETTAAQRLNSRTRRRQLIASSNTITSNTSEKQVQVKSEPSALPIQPTRRQRQSAVTLPEASSPRRRSVDNRKSVGASENHATRSESTTPPPYVPPYYDEISSSGIILERRLRKRKLTESALTTNPFSKELPPRSRKKVRNSYNGYNEYEDDDQNHAMEKVDDIPAISEKRRTTGGRRSRKTRKSAGKRARSTVISSEEMPDIQLDDNLQPIKAEPSDHDEIILQKTDDDSNNEVKTNEVDMPTHMGAGESDANETTSGNNEIFESLDVAHEEIMLPQELNDNSAPELFEDGGGGDTLDHLADDLEPNSEVVDSGDTISEGLNLNSETAVSVEADVLNAIETDAWDEDTGTAEEVADPLAENSPILANVTTVAPDIPDTESVVDALYSTLDNL